MASAALLGEMRLTFFMALIVLAPPWRSCHASHAAVADVSGAFVPSTFFSVPGSAVGLTTSRGIQRNILSLRSAGRIDKTPVALTTTPWSWCRCRSASGKSLATYPASPISVRSFSLVQSYKARTALAAACTTVPAGPALPGGVEDALRDLAARLLPVLAYLWNVLRATLVAIGPSPLDVQLITRLSVAAALGMVIGLERRTSHRPAGVRTMSIVAMGACTFTIVSQFGFAKADQARVAASVASGVGFIGAGVITTSMRDDSNPMNFQSANDVEGEVKGLTTASAIWITSGLGMACGAGLFFTAITGTIMSVAILKVSRLQTTVERRWKKIRPYVRPRKVEQEREAAAAARKLAAAKAAEEAQKKNDNKTDGTDYENAERENISSEPEPCTQEELEREVNEIEAERRALRKERGDAIKRAMDPDRDVSRSATEVMGRERQRRAMRDDDNSDDDADDGDREYGYFLYEKAYDPFFGKDQVSEAPAGVPVKIPLSRIESAKSLPNGGGGGVWVRSQVLSRRRRMSKRIGLSGFQTASDVSSAAIPPSLAGELVPPPNGAKGRRAHSGKTGKVKREQSAGEDEEGRNLTSASRSSSLREGYRRPVMRNDESGRANGSVTDDVSSGNPTEEMGRRRASHGDKKERQHNRNDVTRRERDDDGNGNEVDASKENKLALSEGEAVMQSRKGNAPSTPQLRPTPLELPSESYSPPQLSRPERASPSEAEVHNAASSSSAKAEGRTDSEEV